MAKKTILILLGCALIASCKDSRAEGYSVLSKNFVQAIQSIQGDYFFVPEAPVHQFFKEITDEKFKKEQQRGYDASHYKSLGEQLCKPIADSYARMLDSGLAGTDAQTFDEELTRAMREAGAYALPLRIEGGQVDAAYYNPNWDRTPGAKYGGNQEFNEYYRRLRGGLGLRLKYWVAPGAYKEGGVLEYSFSYPDDSASNHIFIRDFQDTMLNQKKLALQRFEFSIDFIHPYLFVFRKNPDDLNKESVFFYIDFPLNVSGQHYGDISRVKQTGKKPEVRCYPVSTSLLRTHGSTDKNYQSEGESMSFVTETDVLTMPLPEGYSRNISHKYEYDIPAANVVEPSVQCWMEAYGYVKSDSGKCLNTGYADEFMEMLNRDLCVGYDFVRTAAKLQYPYHAKAWVFKPEYIVGATYDNARCNPESDSTNEKGTKDE